MRHVSCKNETIHIKSETCFFCVIDENCANFAINKKTKSMKRILYLIALAVFFIIMSTTTSNAKELADNNGEITLTVAKDDTRHIGHGHDVEPDKAGTPRSIILQPAYAYLYDNVVNVSFNENIESATVIVTNESTGETVYSETHSSPTALNIDLNGENVGNYLIEIEADDVYMTGTFNL